MKAAIISLMVAGLLLTGIFAGCVGGNEKVNKAATACKCGSACPKGGNCTGNCMCNETAVDFSTIMKQAPTDVKDGVAHWKFTEGMAFYFQYDVAQPTGASTHIKYDMNLPEGVKALEVLVDWESQFMDLDLFLLKKGKDIGVSSAHIMMMDPTGAALGDQGTTWEYINLVANKTKKFSLPETYTIDIDEFNNWDPQSQAAPTPFTVDVWVYTEAPAQWHPHQDEGQ
ncbi:MAG: hypothetical protein PHH26_00105 [Candidatus Thermoplasmatota archaeon]|nr:hypothetical protein [Candidatus Thermoplasmatota archaeon]